MRELDYAVPDMAALRLPHGQVDESAAAIMTIVSTPGEVDELVGNHERAGRYFFFEAPRHAGPYHVSHADFLERGEVSLVGYLVRRYVVLAAMSRQKRDRHAFMLADEYVIGELPVLIRLIEFRDDLELRKCFHPRAPDDPDDWLFIAISTR